MNNLDVTEISNSPEFKSLVRMRRNLALPIVLFVIMTYFGFISLIAFNPAVLAQTLGGHISIGIYAGLLLLLTSFIATVIYVRVSDKKIAALQKEIQDKYK